MTSFPTVSALGQTSTKLKRPIVKPPVGTDKNASQPGHVHWFPIRETFPVNRRSLLKCTRHVGQSRISPLRA